MPIFKKKPVKVKARQYKGKSSLRIKTLEGMMTAQPGDWIITGIKGEKYACKPDIFKKTYDPA